MRSWAQETYADARDWGVTGSTLADRTEHLQDYFQHGELFAQADRKASTAARDFIASTYTPVGNWLSRPLPSCNPAPSGTASRTSRCR